MHSFFTGHKEDIEKYESARLMSQHMVSGGQFLKPERQIHLRKAERSPTDAACVSALREKGKRLTE